MKTIVTLLCLLFIAFKLPVSAQNAAPISQTQDTLIIKLQGQNQVYIIGGSLKKLTDYQRADTLKNLFFADLERTLVVNNFPETPKRIHYLVNAQGKRRLKAEIPGETETVFDLEFEKRRLTQDLPPLHYTIYDLPQNVQIHYFLEDTSAFEMAERTSLNEALLKFREDKKKLTGLTSYKVEQTGFGFEKRSQKRKMAAGIEGLGHAGAMLLGNQLSPIIGYDLFFTITKTPVSFINNLRLGLSYTPFVLSDFKDGQFQNINPGNYWQIILQSNANFGKDNWFGISAGQIKTLNPIGLPEAGFKWGLIINHNRDSFSYDIIDLGKLKTKFGKRKQLFMFTYRRSIL